jgi:hypothetical protein
MKYLFLPLLFLSLTLSSFKNPEPLNYKCMIQMTNYSGEGAYVVISLMSPEGEYVKTLYVQGEDSEWYHDIPEWWKFYGKKRTNIDAITGETIAGGERSLCVLELNSEYMDQGYTLRFETAVEDQEYHKADLEIVLNQDNLKMKHEGSGFIRYVRMIAN